MDGKIVKQVERERLIVRAAGDLVRSEFAIALTGAGMSTESGIPDWRRLSQAKMKDVAYWKNIPVKVWEYTIGGYQVIKKWLSYREADLLERPLTSDEAREVMNIARRIAAILLLQPALDENYYQCKANTYKWPEGAA